MRPQNKVKIRWSPDFAYAIGLLTTDGNLSPDVRHINFTSKDHELAILLKLCLGLKNKIGRKANGNDVRKKYYVIQFGDVVFYDFLLQIGLKENKSKTLDKLDIPKKYFYDFLRGHLDGDGTFYSYYDPRWRSSFMFYVNFISASKKHIEWIRSELNKRLGVKGHVSKSVQSSIYSLRYAKAESLKLLPKLYYDSKVACLRRKRRKIERAIGKMK